MRSFDSFIFDPEEVRNKLPVADWRGAKVLRDLNENEQLDAAVGMELQFMQERQPRLYNAATVLAGYLRRQIDPSRPASEQILELGLMDEYVHYGFALGAIACRPQFVVPLKMENLYADIEQSSYDVFRRSEGSLRRPEEAGNDLELLMLLDAVRTNTAEKTEKLRETVDIWINYDRKTEGLEQATTLGALLAYSLMTYTRNERYYRRTTERAYQEHEQARLSAYPGLIKSTDEAYVQYRAAKDNLDATPGSIRRMLSWREHSPRPASRPQKP